MGDCPPKGTVPLLLRNWRFAYVRIRERDSPPPATCYDTAMPPRTDDPACGNCGYCVRGISALLCPECGADLREVGIIAPNAHHPLPRYVKAIFWTLVLPVPALLISWVLLMTVMPFAVTRKFDSVITCQSPYITVTVDVWGRELLAAPAMAHEVAPNFENVTVVNGSSIIGFSSFMDVNLKTGAYNFYRNSANVQQPGGFSSAVIRQFLVSPTINPADPTVQKACDGIYAAIMEVAQGNDHKSTPILDAWGKKIGTARPSSIWVVHDEPSPWVIVALGALWLVVWLYGLRAIFLQISRGGLSP
jgi:hypothetical protein